MYITYVNKNGVEFEITISAEPFRIKDAWGFRFHVVEKRTGFSTAHRGGILKSACPSKQEAEKEARTQMLDYLKLVNLDYYDVYSNSYNLVFPDTSSGWYLV